VPYGVYLSAAGANAQTHRLQVLSNNLANVNTSGFKPEHAVLQARFAELIEQGEVTPGHGGIDDLGGGVTIAPAATSFDLGVMRKTGNQTDFAIQEPDTFFVVQRGEERFLTRAGEFLFDNTGRMITQAGEQVLGHDGNPIQIAPHLPYQIQPGGRIAQGADMVDLMLAKPKSLGDLAHAGGNLFRPLADFDLATADQRPVTNGMLEASAVSPTAAMMELIDASRAYEANVRMIQNQDHVVGSLIGRILQR
jgi:flagellar basal-body rod protein FlgF